MSENYWDDAKSDAAEMVENFRDEIVEMLIDDGKASDDFNNDYPNGDAYHHESHVDKWYDLQDAAAVLQQLSDHKETDTGLWEGLEPEAAIGAQATFTYGNAVAYHWGLLIEEINDAWGDIGPGFDMFDSIAEELSEHLDGSEFDYPDFAALKKKAANLVISKAIQ